MTSSRPYILRALYEWINDNQLTPYVVVNAEMSDVYVPKEYVAKGQIVLNVAPDAVHELQINNVELQFYASFAGISRHISVPIEAVIAIYAQENGEGMVFGDEPGGDTPPDNSRFASKDKGARKSHLKVVK
jgi:stringent starvation protein B